MGLRGGRSRPILIAIAALAVIVVAFRAPIAGPESPEARSAADGAVVVGGRSGVTNPPEAQSTVDATPLAPGQQPPQFVVTSIDGSCETRDGTIRKFLDIGNAASARFTFFVSGLCLLPDERKKLYQGPKHAPGQSDLSFADADMVGERIRTFTDMYRAGHEVGTHFLGHFCGSGSGVGTWDTADWASEIEQSRKFLDEWVANNPQAAGMGPLPFDSSVFRGDRTPCLLGKRPQMWKAFIDAGFRYEASDPGVLQWPRKVADGKLWQFPLPALRLSGTNKWVLSMDYNFLANQNNTKTQADADTCAKIEEQTYQTYMDALAALESGNRAPLIIGTHLNDWVCGAYIKSLQRFIADVPNRFPGVRMVSFSDLARWLDAQDPAVLRDLQAKTPQRY